MHFAQPYAIGANADIGNERTRQPARNDADRALNRLVRPHEAGGATTLERELFDQRDVEVRTDAECEHPARSTLFRNARRNCRRIALAHRRLAIGEE